jgi:hypothetical protein
MIKKVVLHQKVTKPWLTREIDKEKAKAYRKEYYAKNKAKFAEYRSAFVEKKPGYHRDYYLQNKDK